MIDSPCIHHPETNGTVRCSRCLRPFCDDCIVHIGGQALCADCKQERLIDLASGVTAGEVQLASLWRRLGAHIIDSLVFGLPVSLLFQLTGITGAISTSVAGPHPSMWNLLGGAFVAGLLQLPLGIAYEGLMLSYRRGQTIGKMALSIRVVEADQNQITPRAAWTRAATRYILGAIISIFEYLPAYFTKEKTAVHDMTANTRVINAE